MTDDVPYVTIKPAYDTDIAAAHRYVALLPNGTDAEIDSAITYVTETFDVLRRACETLPVPGTCPLRERCREH